MESKAEKLITKKLISKRKLFEVAYEITYQCNLRCVHCYNGEDIRLRNDEMNTQEVKYALTSLKNFGVQKLKIGGGEPLIRKDFFELYRFAKDLGFEVDFASNGILVRSNLEKMQKEGVKKIQLSLDNIGDKHDYIRNKKGLFKIVQDTINELSENNIKINIATTLTKYNHYDLREILQFCEDNNIFRWKLMKYIPKSAQDPLLLTPLEYKIAVEKTLGYKAKKDVNPEIIVAREFDQIHTPTDYNDMQCFGGKTFLSLKPNGDITPCSYIYDISCGNILRDSMENIWNSYNMINFSIDKYDSGCRNSAKCRGGCKAITHFLKFEGCDPYCWVKK